MMTRDAQSKVNRVIAMSCILMVTALYSVDADSGLHATIEHGNDRITVTSPLIDDDLHTLAGMSIFFFTSAFLAATELDSKSSVLIALSAASLAGLGKEVWDSFGFGTPEASDFVWTMLGGAVGTIGAMFVFATLYESERPDFSSSILFSSLGVTLAIPLIAGGRN